MNYHITSRKNIKTSRQDETRHTQDQYKTLSNKTFSRPIQDFQKVSSCLGLRAALNMWVSYGKHVGRMRHFAEGSHKKLMVPTYFPHRSHASPS